MAGMHVGRSAALVAFVLCSSVRAHAESEDVVLEYEAFAGCPDRAWFEQEVRALSPRAQFVQAAPGARQFRVLLERRAQGVEGTLAIRASTGPSERKVSGKSCSEVASALALATAIALDPTVLGGTDTISEDQTPEAPPEPKPSARSPPSGSPMLDRTPRATAKKTDRVLLGLGFGVQSAIVPEAGLRFALRLGWQPAARGAPLLFTEGAYVLPVSTDFVEFSDLLAVRGGAALSVLESDPWSAGPELSFELGNIKASGNPETVSNPRVHAGLWAAGELGVFGRFRATPVFVVELAGGALLPFIRRDYVYRPRSPAAEPVTVHSIASVGLSAGVRAALFL
jgi:hypothetical protein